MSTQDSDMVQHIIIELAFFIKYRAQCFSAISNRDLVQNRFNNGRDWDYSSYLKSTIMRTRNTSSMWGLTNHTTETPSQAVISIMQGMMKSFSSTIDFIKTRSVVTPHLSYSLFAMNKISMIITGNSAIAQLNERFTSINNVGVFFQCFTHVDQSKEYILNYSLQILQSQVANCGLLIYSNKCKQVCIRSKKNVSNLRYVHTSRNSSPNRQTTQLQQI